MFKLHSVIGVPTCSCSWES